MGVVKKRFGGNIRLKGKRYLARYESLFKLCFGLIGYSALLIISILLLFYSNYNKIGVLILIGFVVLLIIVALILCIPEGPFSTITFYEKEFCYQKHLFGKKEWMAYEDIELLNIDFCSYPAGITPSTGRVPPDIEIIYKYVTLYRINITYKVVSEFLKHIEKKRIHVNFESLWTFRKKYRKLLYDYLTIWKKIDLEQKLGKKHKR